MPAVNINGVCIYAPAASYTVSKADSARCFELLSGNFKVYPIRRGRFSLELSFACDTALFNQLDSVISENDELSVEFDFAGERKNLFMMRKSYRAVCSPKNLWNVQLSLIESRRMQS